MNSRTRSRVLVALTGLLILLLPAGAARAAESPAIEKFAAVNCVEAAKECAHEVVEINLGPPFGVQKYSVTKEPNKAEAEAQGFVTAGGHVPFGVTDFKLQTTGSL